MTHLKLVALTVALVGSGLAACSQVQPTQDEAEVPAQAQEAMADAFTSTPVMLASDELEWVLQPHGAEMALVWGDPATGPSAYMVKYPPNWSRPANLPADAPNKMHMHSAGYHNVILSGGGKHWHEGQSEDDVPFLTEGAYFYQPGGQYHTESFRSEEPTILYAYFEGPRDTFIDGIKVYPLD